MRPFRCLVLVLLECLGGSAEAAEASADALLARYFELQGRLSESPFGRPISVDSIETSDGVAGEAHALVAHPFATVSLALERPAHWCDILDLHPNTKYCRAMTTARGGILDVGVGKKGDQPLADAHRLELAYRVVAERKNYLQVVLRADEGPFGTRDYRILLEAVVLARGRTFIRLSYSYAHGPAAALAVRGYFATVASDRVGFSVVGLGADGQPRYIGGLRGAIERNTMRYIIAIEAFLGALSAPPAARFEKRLHDWFAAVERYPRQLHDMEQSEYLDVKRRERSRQMSLRSGPAGGG